MSRLLQPRSKSLATSDVSSQSVAATKEHSQSSPGTPAIRRGPRQAPLDPISDRATQILIRRTLCSQLGEKGRSTPTPIDALLPPLTSSNEVDTQLYAYISIIIRDFVQTWYGKITPDQIFVEEIVRIIAHCTRALEQRLREVDLESVVFDELPELLEVHVKAYRTSRNALHPPPFEQDARQIYHSLWPFPPLTPVPEDGDDDPGLKIQQQNESEYRQLLVQGVLAVLLPTEDLENECLTALVGQIFSDMIIGGSIGGKTCEPWVLWEGIAKIAEAIKAQLPKSKAQVRVERSNSDLMGTVPPRLNGGPTRAWIIQRSLQKTFWLILQYGFMAFTAVRFLIVTFATASSLPSRIQNTIKVSSPTLSKHEVEAADLSNTESDSSNRPTITKQPILKMKIWSCASSMLDLDVRMPWLSATISLLQWAAITGPGEVGNTDGLIDKFLSHALKTHVLNPSLLPLILRLGRTALFPNNALGPPRLVPSSSEQLLIRRRCADAILDLVPGKVQDVFFGVVGGRGGVGNTSMTSLDPIVGIEEEEEDGDRDGDLGLGLEREKEKESNEGKERRIKEVEDALNVFDDSYCNKHFLYGVVELVVVRLMPELAEKGVAELLEERLN